MSIQGQWFGVFKGTNSGRVIVNLDRRAGAYSGAGVALENDTTLPNETYNIVLRLDEATGEIYGHADRTGYFAIVNNKWKPIDTQTVKTRYPNLQRESNRAQLTGRYTKTKDHLSLSFATNAGTFGEVSAMRERVEGESVVPLQSISWRKLKDHLSHKGRIPSVLYRGQPNRWPLRTRFHRAGRFDTTRFAIEDVEHLKAAIASVTDVAFDTRNAEMMGAILGLAQHHGFPTPLLDWTESPYVAAYFACREAIDRNDTKPTLFVFDRASWMKSNVLATNLSDPLPAVTFIKPFPLKNPRLLPQQSVLMFCNVDNFEKYVIAHGEAHKVSYLKGFRLKDSPIEVLKDLRQMGVYAASLFPGLDGMCRGLFEQLLEI